MATPEYDAWVSMRARCENEARANYKHYGARGIRVCAAWRESFESFLADVGPRPSGRHSLDRIDNQGNYEPGNVRWATWIEQNRNRRNTWWVTIRGERMPLTEAVERFRVVGEITARKRIERGWPDEDALLRPPGPNRGTSYMGPRVGS